MYGEWAMIQNSGQSTVNERMTGVFSLHFSKYSKKAVIPANTTRIMIQIISRSKTKNIETIFWSFSVLI